MKELAKDMHRAGEQWIVDCPHCHRTFAFGPKDFCTEATCPHCEKESIIPKQDGTPPSEEEVGLAMMRLIGRAIMEDDDSEEEKESTWRSPKEIMRDFKDFKKGLFG